MTKPIAPKVSLTARLDERFFAPVRNASFARRTWFSVTLAIIVFVHAALLAGLLWRDREDPMLQAKAEETPIEVVVEQPKPQTPPSPQPQPPAAKPPIEKPATSAPRAPNEETVDRQSDDKDTHAPKAPTPVAAAPPEQTEAKTEPDAKPEKAEPEKPDPQKAETKPEPPKPDDALKKDAEALDKLTPPEPPKRPKLAQAKPVKPHPKTALQQLAGSSDLPDYTFAKPMKKRAKVFGGTEDDRYLAVVYGMITQQHNRMQMPSGEWTVAVSFQVDGHGQLVGVQVTQRSGYREIDMAAIEAVESAAPFPPPPSGALTGLVARLRSSSDPRPMVAGER